MLAKFVNYIMTSLIKDSDIDVDSLEISDLRYNVFHRHSVLVLDPNFDVYFDFALRFLEDTGLVEYDDSEEVPVVVVTEDGEKLMFNNHYKNVKFDDVMDFAKDNRQRYLGTVLAAISCAEVDSDDQNIGTLRGLTSYLLPDDVRKVDSSEDFETNFEYALDKLMEYKLAKKSGDDYLLTDLGKKLQIKFDVDYDAITIDVIEKFVENQHDKQDNYKRYIIPLLHEVSRGVYNADPKGFDNLEHNAMVRVDDGEDLNDDGDFEKAFNKCVELKLIRVIDEISLTSKGSHLLSLIGLLRDSKHSKLSKVDTKNKVHELVASLQTSLDEAKGLEDSLDNY